MVEIEVEGQETSQGELSGFFRDWENSGNTSKFEEICY